MRNLLTFVAFLFVPGAAHADADADAQAALALAAAARHRTNSVVTAKNVPCICGSGDDCKCAAGVCPGGCPVAGAQSASSAKLQVIDSSAIPASSSVSEKLVTFPYKNPTCTGPNCQQQTWDRPRLFRRW